MLKVENDVEKKKGLSIEPEHLDLNGFWFV